MSATAETSGEKSKISLGNRIKLGVGAALGIGSVIFGGVVGYELNKSAHATDNRHHLENAANDRACLRAERNPSVVTQTGGRAVVRLTDLSPDQQAVCGFSGVEGALVPYDRSTGVGVPLPHDSKIITHSVRVTMPSTGELQDSMADNIAAANDGLNVLEDAEVGGAVLAGGFFGGAAFIIGAAGLATAADRMRRG